MKITEILAPPRVVLDRDGVVHSKPDVLRRVAELIAGDVGLSVDELEQKLIDREQLGTTGIGDGVAIPHASVDAAHAQIAALIVCPNGVEFEAIDGDPVSIIFGVVGPRGASGEHLRVLARISRLLRDAGTRAELAAALTAEELYQTVEARDRTL